MGGFNAGLSRACNSWQGEIHGRCTTHRGARQGSSAPQDRPGRPRMPASRSSAFVVQQHSPKRNSPFAISIVAEFGSASGPAFSRQWTMSISPFLDAIGLEVTVCDADAVLGPCWGNSSRADSLVPVPPNACHTHSRVTVVHPSWSGLFHLVPPPRNTVDDVR